MKKIISLIMVTLLSINTYGQIIKIHVEKIYFFNHLNVISTAEAFKNDYVNFENYGITDADYTFNFNDHTMILKNRKKGEIKRNLIFFKVEDNSFITSFIDDSDSSQVNVLYNENVLCFTWEEKINNMSYIKGWISTIKN